jgi:hypothetical protein
MKSALAAIVLFFLFQSAHAQDTLKHTDSHKHKTHISDSAKVSHLKHESHFKDSTTTHKSEVSVMPKYPRDGYIAVMYGLAAPTGSYSQNEGAITGSDFSLSAAFPGIISRWGIAFKFDHGSNGINADRLSSTLTNNTGFANITCSLPYTLGHCSYSSYLAGLYITYPGNRLTIDLRILAGAMSATLPSVTAEYYDQTTGTDGLQYQGQTSGSAFAIDFGIEARYPVTHRLSVFGSIDYLHADPSFLIVTSGAAFASDGSIILGSGQEVTSDQAFNLFNLSLGMGYTISAQKAKLTKANYRTDK